MASPLCPVHGTCTWYVPPSGDPATARLAIIGEAPGETEVQRGVPFVGPAGELLWRELTALGIRREECWVYNAVPCLDLTAAKTPDAATAKRWRPHLLATLEDVAASVVILLGRVAVSTVLDRRRSDVLMMDENGTVHTLTLASGRTVRCVVVLHPAAVLRSGGSGELLARFRAGLRRAVDVLHGAAHSTHWYPGHRICRTATDLQDLIRTMRAASEFTFDIETVRDRPVWIGLYAPSGPAFGIPVGDWGGCQEADVKAALQEVFTLRPGQHAIGHNVNYDLRWLRRWGYLRRDQYATDDTLLLAHTLDPRRSGFLGLKELGRLVFDIEPYWLGIKQAVRADITQAPLDDVAAYNGRDCVLTYRLFQHFMQELAQDTRLLRLYLRLIMPVNRILLDIEEHGLPVDLVAFEDLHQAWERDQQDIRRELDRYAEINWNSPKQVATLLYDQLHLPVVKLSATSARSTDEETLRRLQGKHPVVDLLLAYREVTKRVGTLESLQAAVSAEDGRIHASFNLAGTVSGRSSSTPNVQNFERGPGIRDIIRASPGYTLVEADLSQIELRWLAVLYEEPTLRQALNEGRDIHLTTAVLAFNKSPEDVTAEERTLGKTVNFSSGYGAGPAKIAAILRRGDMTDRRAAEILGLTAPKEDTVLELARRLHRAFHTQFPRVRPAWDAIRAQLQHDGIVRSAFGRPFMVERFTQLDEAAQHTLTREAANFVVQSSAADTLWLCLVDVAAVAAEVGARIINVVHDSILAEVPQDRVDEYARRVYAVMRAPRFAAFDVTCPIALGASVKCGERWGHVQEIDHAMLDEVPVMSHDTGTAAMQTVPLYSVQDYADRYLRHGWCVVPVEHGSKTPAISWKEFQEQQPSSAMVRAWVQGGYGLGIVTGKISELVVVDVDVKNGGAASLDALQLHSPIRVRTGGGGLHLYYRYPAHIPRVPSKTGIWPGIDVRADGGFVVAPPTQHASGGIYQFENGALDHLPPTPLPELPPVVLEAVLESKTSEVPSPPEGMKQLPDDAQHRVVDLLLPYWQPGTRHVLALGIAGMLAKRGYRREDIAHVLDGLMDAAGDGETEDRQRVLDDTFAKLAKGEMVAGHKRVAEIAGDGVVRELLGAIGTVRRIANVECSALGEFVGLPTYTPEWIIEGLLPVGGLGQLAGSPGVGKTTLALQLAAQVAAGTPFLGEYRVPQPRRVLYLQADNPVAMMLDLVDAIIKRQPEAAWNVFLANFLEPMRLDREADFEVIAELCQIYQPALLILDTMRDFHGANENDPNVVAEVMEGLKRLRTRYNTAILFLNHLSKHMGYRRAAIEAHMGTIRWVTPVDLDLLLEDVDEEGEYGLAKLVFAKVRWAKKPAPRWIRREGRWFVLGGVLATSPSSESTNRR